MDEELDELEELEEEELLDDAAGGGLVCPPPQATNREIRGKANKCFIVIKGPKRLQAATDNLWSIDIIII